MTLEDIETTKKTIEEERKKMIEKMIEQGADEERIAEERQKQGEISDDEIKATFSMMTIKDKDKKDRVRELRHRVGHYDDYLKRIEYYLTGKKELAKQNYLIENRAKLLRTNDEGER